MLAGVKLVFGKRLTDEDIKELRNVFTSIDKALGTDTIGIWTGGKLTNGRLFYVVINKWELEYLKIVKRQLHTKLNGLKFIRVSVLTDLADRRIL